MLRCAFITVLVALSAVPSFAKPKHGKCRPKSPCSDASHPACADGSAPFHGTGQKLDSRQAPKCTDGGQPLCKDGSEPRPPGAGGRGGKGGKGGKELNDDDCGGPSSVMVAVISVTSTLGFCAMCIGTVYLCRARKRMKGISNPNVGVHAVTVGTNPASNPCVVVGQPVPTEKPFSADAQLVVA